MSQQTSLTTVTCLYVLRFTLTVPSSTIISIPVHSTTRAIQRELLRRTCPSPPTSLQAVHRSRLGSERKVICARTVV
jgi:hypothetical protein